MAEFKLGRLRFVWKGEWTTGTAYVKDDIVRYGGSSFVCVAAHTAAADFYTNFDAGKWELMTSGLQWSTSPWTSGVFYPEGTVVRYGGKIYVAVDGHQSQANFNSDFDAGDWQLLVDGIQWKTSPWSSATLYKEGDLVRHGGRVYIAIDGHTSSSSFEADSVGNKWQLFVDGTQWVNAWTAGTLYKFGDIARVSGKTYICINEHTADGTQRGGFYNDVLYWNLYSNGSAYRGVWDTTEYYWIGDVVRHGAKSYICVFGHEAATDFYTDVDAGSWELYNDGQQWKTDPWTIETLYKEGDLVRHGAKVYICVNGHLSSSNGNLGFNTDLANNNWQLFTDGIQWVGAWVTGTAYKLGDIARYGGKSYVCSTAHVAAADFYTDVDAASWQLLVDGTQWKTSPWNTSTLYKEGDLVRYGGRVYICVNGHTSTVDTNRFDQDFDAGNWNLFADGTQWKSAPWTASEYYKTGDIVKYGGKTYIAVDDHTANATQNGGFYIDLPTKWNLYADGNEWVGDWSTSTYYKLGDIVRYDGNVYVCVEGHTSAATIELGLENDLALDSTAAKWDVFSEGFKYKGIWTTATKYNVNDVVKFGSSLYICVSYHTSGMSFAEINWNILIGGLEFEDTWNPSVEYQIGDIVTYGGYSYVAKTRNTGVIPAGFASDWELLTTGFKVTGEWSATRSYKVGEVVKYGGSTYVAIVETSIGQAPILNDGSTSILWEVVAPGFKWRSEWLPATDYRVGDAVRWAGSTYVCVLDHTSVDEGANQPDNDANGIYWDILAEGGGDNKLARRGDLLTRDAIQNKRLPRGQVGQVLQVSGNDVVWDYFNVVDNVYYVTTDGIDSPERGTTLQTPFKTIKYATEYILADEANRAPATIYVKTGTYSEQLPIIIPANVAVVGDELRSTKVRPAPGKGVHSVTIINPGSGYGSTPAVTFQQPQLAGGVTATGVAVMSGNSVASITITNPGSGYTSAPVVTITGGSPAVAASANSTLEAKAYNQTNMFYLRDSTGLRNMTLLDLEVELGPVNQYLTKRPETECCYVSLDPGTGPGDESTWITTRSPYVQNVTTYGSGAVGMKVDGSLHNGGFKTMVCNDYTQVISDGIGIWCINNGRVEAVSVFTYYAHLGYLAEDGGVIRGTNGNCSYGTFGVASEGVDPSEVSKLARVDNRREEAQIANTFVDGQGIVVLEYSNAGQNYQVGNTTFAFEGSGVANSIDVDQVVVQDGGVMEVRVLESGNSWLSVVNNAQDGNNLQIRLSASDVQTTNAYVGERIVIIDGQGVGQYGYVVNFNGGTKVALVAKESFIPLTSSLTSSVDNSITVTDTTTLVPNQPIGFNGTPLGGLAAGTIYYVKTILSSTKFTVSTVSGGTTQTLTTDNSGTMTIHSLGWESLYGQTIVNTLDTTTRYVVEPRVVFSTGTGASAEAVISQGVESFSLSANGGYYQTAPAVIITGLEDDATGATATANVTGSVQEVRIRDGGSNFNTQPTVTFIGGGLPNNSPNHASGTANITGKIVSVSITDRGYGYEEPPEVQISGPGYNNDGYISASITNIVGNINVVEGGSNYTAVPNVIISGGGGSGAEGIANLNAVVTGFTIVEGGSGYTPLTTSVTIVNAPGDTTGDGATATAVIDNGVEGGPGVITGITLGEAGSGYTKPPIVVITSTGLGTDAQATALINGAIASVTITNGGSGYITAPDVAFSSGSATATAEITGAVNELQIINGGTGFTGPATLTIVGQSPAASAAAVAVIDKVVESITIDSPGSGYTSPPTVSISGGNGTGALGTAILNASVASITVTNPGKNYDTAPTVTFAGAHNFRSIVTGEAYYKSTSSLIAISNLQLTQTLAAIEYVKTLATAIATNTDPVTLYQGLISRTGTATAPVGALAQTNFWVDVIKAISENGESNSQAASLINSNRAFIIAEAAAYAAANNSGGIVYNAADLRKRVGALVDAVVYDMTNGTAERSVAVGQKYGYLIAGEFTATKDILVFVEDLIQDIILNVAVTPLNTVPVTQTFAELLASEITAPTAVGNLMGLIKTTVDLDSTLGNLSNSTYTDLLKANKVWIQAEVIEYIKATYPTFEYNQTLCARDVGLIVDALAQDVRYSMAAIPVATTSTTNVLSDITILSGGDGYGQGTTVTISGGLDTPVFPETFVPVNATATPIITNGVITGFNITNPGKFYATAPDVAINADTGSGALARVQVLGGIVQEFRIIHPGSGYTAPPYVKLVDPNNTIEGVWQVRIGNGVLDQPTFTNRGTGYIAARAFVSSETGFADTYQVGEFVYVKNMTNVPTPGANIQFGDNPIFYKLVSVRELAGDTGLIGGRSLIVANRAFIQRQVIAYIDGLYPTLNYNKDLCFRDVGLIVDAIVADIFGETERGVAAGQSYYRNASGIASITGGQLTATISALDKIEDYIVDIVQNIDIPRNQLFELQVKEPNITTGDVAIAPVQNTIAIIKDIIQNGSTIYAVQDLLLDNKAYIQAEVIAFVNTTYPELVYNQELCRRDVGLIVDALAYDLFTGLATNYNTPDVPSGLTRSREAGLRYYSNPSAQIAITTQLNETLAAIEHIKVVALAVISNQAPAIVYQSEVPRHTNLSVSTNATLNGRISDGINEIVNIIENGLDVLPLGTYSARLQISPQFNVNNVPDHDAQITFRNKYSQVRITGHDFLNVGTGNRAETNYPGIPVNAPEPENEVLEQGGGRVFYTSTDQDGNFRVGELFSVEQATGIATLNADAFNLSGLNELSLGGVNLGGTGATITEFSTDSTFLANSDTIVPTQKAIKTYIASQLGSGGGNLAVNAITAGDIQVQSTEISTNAGTLDIIVPSGVQITEFVTSQTNTSGSLVVTGGVGISENLNVGGYFDVDGNAGVGGDLTVTGNLTVNGTQTTLNVGTLSVEDINVTIAKDAATAADANGAGITVNGPTTPATMTYANADDSWNFNKLVKATSIQNTPIGSTTRSSGAFTTLTSNGATTFTANTASTGSTTGTLVVTGGVGISENLNVAANTTTSGLTATGSVQMNPTNASVQLSPSGTGGVTIAPSGSASVTINPSLTGTINNVDIGGSTRGSGSFTTLTANSSTTLTANTGSTSTSTGTLVVTGGVGISERLYAGSIQNTPIGSVTANTGAFTTLSASSTTTLSPANANVAISPTGTGVVTISPATAGSIDRMNIGATTRGTGAFTTLTSNGATTFTAGTSSTTSGTGTLVVTGGVGISENLNVGGNAIITGNLTVNGTTTTVNSTTVTVDDILLELGDVATPTDATANGGGILLKGATNKTITWSSATGRWSSNVGFDAASIQNTPIGSSTASTGAFTTLTANSATTLTANTGSTSTSTGTLVVTGGVGISERLYAGSIQNTPIGSVTANSGAFTTLSASSTVGLSPANAGVTISPTGTGTVTVNPATAGTINNMSIGVTTAAAGRFTTLTATSTFSISDTTASTSTTTGALVVSGGAGIAGNINVGGSATIATSQQITGGNLGSTLGNRIDYLNLRGTPGSNSNVFDVFMFRDSAGSTWTTAGTRFQQKVDSTWMAYQQFNGTNVNGGIEWGTGTTTTSAQAIPATMRLDSSGSLRLLTNIASSSTTTGTLIVSGGVGIAGQLTAATIVETSSIAYKENVNPITNALDAVMQLVGVTYARKDTHKYEAGLIAEEVNKVLPDLVSKNEEGNPEGIQYTKLTAYLIEAVKALKAEIDQLKGVK